jgi:hypothetical protein
MLQRVGKAINMQEIAVLPAALIEDGFAALQTLHLVFAEIIRV